MGIAQTSHLSREISRRAVRAVEDWMDQYRIEPKTLDDVHLSTVNQTGLTIEHIVEDCDLDRISTRYQKETPGLPVQLEFAFERDTEALVFRRPSRDCAFLAVIDARGDRIYRRWFAERHEVAHLLVPDPNPEEVWRRTRIERPEPLEQVIDEVAASVGFYEPLIAPVLARVLHENTFVLDAFDAARDLLAPDASREACYRAFARIVDFPLVLLRVDHRHRKRAKAVKDVLETIALRAITVISNDLASRHRMEIWRNYRIPQHSVIHDAFTSGSEIYSQIDRLEEWHSSSGTSLGPCRVMVTARGRWAAVELAA